MTIHTAMTDFSAARDAMIDSQLRPQGVNDPVVLAAMASVPRESFVPEDRRALAYADRAVPIGEGRQLPSATATGLLLTQLAPRKGERALVVGAASGYCAALLDRIGLDVVAVEESPALCAWARDNGISVVQAPLAEGHADGAPYDLLLIDGAVEDVPQALIDQLADGGRCGTGLTDRSLTRLAVGRKSGGKIGFITIADVGLTVLPGFGKPRPFTF